MKIYNIFSTIVIKTVLFKKKDYNQVFFFKTMDYFKKWIEVFRQKNKCIAKLKKDI